MTNKQVCQAFVDGATKGKSLHIFIEGNVIYSYGKHWPLGIRYGNSFAYNADKYSMTTSRHLSHLRQAIGIKPVIASPLEWMKKMVNTPNVYWSK